MDLTQSYSSKSIILVAAITCGLVGMAGMPLCGGENGSSCAEMRVSIENPPPVLTELTFDELFAACRPCADKEAWSEVDWVGEFWEGRRQAARQGKPMFIFAMNGHPLGCV